MPNALTFIIGGDSRPFAQEMRAMESIAQSSARSISGRMAEAGHAGFSGIIREAITIPREIIEGRGAGRVIGSSSILLQYLSNLVSGSNKAGGAAHAAADAYEEMALRQSIAARKSVELASALEKEFTSNGAATEEELKGAVAAREKAVAEEQIAVAFRNKALAARRDAEEESALAKLSKVGGLAIGPLMAGVAIAAAIGVSIYGVYRWAKATAETLAGLKTPNFHPEYIAKHLQAMNQVAEGWKEISKEVDKASAAYNSVASQAERLAKITEMQQNHEKRMLELAKERELNGARSPSERLAIEKRYSDATLELEKRHHREVIENMRSEALALAEEGKSKKAEADSIKVTSKQHDEEDLQNKKQMAEEAQKYLDEAQASGSPEERHKALRAATSLFNFTTSGTSGVTAGDVVAADRAADAEAHARIRRYHEAVDITATNDETRKRRDELTKEAGASLSRVAVLGSAIPEEEAKAQKQEKLEAEYEAAKLAEGASKHRDSHLGSMTLTNLQKIGGAYLMPGMKDLEQTAKESNHLLRSIDSKLARIGGSHSLGGVHH